jgi:hypothetical protein
VYIRVVHGKKMIPPSLAAEEAPNFLDDGLERVGRDLLREDEPERRRGVEADQHAGHDDLPVGMAVRRRRNVAEREQCSPRDSG